MKQRIIHIYIRQRRRLEFRLRRGRLYWRHYDKQYGWLWRVTNGAGALLLFAGFVAIPVLSNFWQQNRYQLDASTIKLVGNTDSSLASKLTYDGSKQEYVFNQAGLTQSASPSDPTAALMKAQAGSSSSNDSLYALELSQTLNKGVAYTDTNTGLSFSLVPEFSGMDGQEEQGHLVYPLDGGNQAIYTLKNNGLKEDIVVPFATSDTMTFSYKLTLPNTLQAKIISGTGDIGIYSADPSLFGNISYGSDTDRSKVMKAQVNSPKNNLVFGLPAPVIKAVGGQPSNASAKFVLKGNTLSVMATDLSSIHGSFSIDPSVVVTASSDFSSGNNEGNIDFGTANQINRGGLTGGSISGGWQSGGTYDSNGDGEGVAGVAYNGYLYVYGGFHTGTHNTRYASLNSTTGAIGTWATTSSPLGRGFMGTAAYNGYIYAVGGNISGSGATATVSYAHINSDGTAGAWASTTSLPSARHSMGVAVYGNYLYSIGGGSSISNLFSDVLYAPIHADGTIGSWTSSSNALPSARWGDASAAYNGYLYTIGGQDGSSVEHADVLYAPINSDGTVGTWQSTTVLPGARHSLIVIVNNGYLYAMGGNNPPASTTYADVYYAPIYANGSVGAWQSTASLNTSRYSFAAAAYNGYLYYAGGYDGTNTYQDSYYAKIDPAGITGAWQAGGIGPTTNGIMSAGVVAYNGYIYALGGYNAISGYLTTVYYAPISSTGIGTWTTATTAFAGGAAGGAVGAAIYNGYMYIFGGFGPFGGGPSAQNDVQYSLIQSNGSLAAWTATTALPFSAQQVPAAAYNGYVYVVNPGTTTTYYAQIASTGALAANSGCGSTWCTTATLNSGATQQGMVAYGGYMYVVGGTSSSAVQYASIGSNGALGTWQNATSLGQARASAGVSVDKGYLYVAGGYDGSTYRSDTVYAQLATTGALATNSGCGSTWCTAASFTTGRANGGTTIYDGYMYLVGGSATAGTGPGAAMADAQYVAINNGGSGTAGTWTATTSLTAANSGATSVAYNGYLYEIGGSVGSAVYYTPLKTDGTLGTTWTPTTSLPVSLEYSSSVAYNGYIYEIGGKNGTTAVSTVYYVPINADGTLGTTWTPTTSLPAAIYWATATEYNGYLYSLGGFQPSCCGAPTTFATVYYVPINADGTLGTTWTPTTSLPAATYMATSVAYNGYLYEIGGAVGTGNAAYYVPINADGTLGTTWTPTTSLPGGAVGAAAVVDHGYLYVTGTGNTAAYYATINSSGTLGTWTTTTSLSNSTTHATSIISNGYIYEIGGNTGSADIANVYYASLNVTPRIGHYSKLIDLGVSATLQSITSNGVLPGGIRNINYRAAGNDGIFGVLTNAGSITGGGAGGGGCGGAGSGTRYVWVSLTLDDSYDAAFADSSGPDANVTDFTINYTSNTGHPAPTVRLRGGMYFNNGSLQPLDTCGP